MATRSIALLVFIFLTADLWADCAPDYRANKTSGLYVTDFVVSGTTTIDSSELARIRSKLIAACVDEDSEEIAERARNLFQNQGYFAVVIKSVRIRPTDPLGVPKPAILEVDVVEGQQFKLAEIRFVGNHAFSEEKLRAAFTLKKGDLFKRDKIASGFNGIRKLYAPRGFGDLTFVPDTESLSDATVMLTLSITEGTQYRMGKLRISAKKEIAEQLQAGWELREGVVFDFTYPDKYVSVNRPFLPIGFTPDGVQLIRNCPDAMVEVRLILDQTDPTLQARPTDVECAAPHDDAK